MTDVPLRGDFIELLVLVAERTPLVFGALPLIEQIQRANVAVRLDESLTPALGFRFQ